MGNAQSQDVTASATAGATPEAANVGKVSATFPCLYLGSTTVSGEGATTSDTACMDAVNRIREPGLPTRKVSLPPTHVHILRPSC